MKRRLAKLLRRLSARQSAPVTSASLTISAPFTIWHDPDYYATFPSFAQTRQGVLMSFRIAPREPHDFQSDSGQHQQHLHPRAALALTTLDADLTATGYRLFDVDLVTADQDPNLSVLPDGSLLMSSFSWRPNGYLLDEVQRPGMFVEKTSGMSAIFWGGFTAISHTQGQTWEPRQYLPALPDYPDLVAGRRGWMGGRHRGQVVATRDGRLLLATYDRADNDATFDSYLYESPDQGRTWSYAGPLAKDPDGKIGFAEPTLVRTTGGDILALHRTFGAGDKLAVCRSSDQGRSWSGFELADVVGHPYHVIMLSDSQGLLVYGVRAKVSSIRARLIDLTTGKIDAGEVMLRDGSNYRDIGYPSGIVLACGRVLVSYYWVDDQGCRYIEAVTISL